MGTVPRKLWHSSRANTEEWIDFWQAPKDRCDGHSSCGQSAICSRAPMECACLPGFEPKSPNDFVIDCVEKKEDQLHACGKRQGKGFIKFSLVKVPDARIVRVFLELTLRDCEIQCLRSCNCTGYASADTNVGGRGCFAWYGVVNDITQYDATDGQDFYLRVNAQELSNSILLSVTVCIAQGFKEVTTLILN